MTTMLSLLWQQIQKYWVLTLVIIVGLIAFIAFAMAVWRFGWDWTGFGGYDPKTHTKTFWDWLQLLIIPSVLAGGVLWFNTQQSKASEKENIDNRRENALQDYIDKMSELMRDKDNPLYKSAKEDEVRKIARVRTLTVLRGLDSVRKGSLLQFLHESGLINVTESDLISENGPIVKLAGADLKDADLKGTDLRGGYLEGANLKGAVLRAYQERNGQLVPPGQITDFETRNFTIIKAHLEGAILRKAILRDAHLEGAILRDAHLEGAILRDAHLEEAHLENAHLNRADLHEVHLNRADLSGADLSGADLSGAILSGATVTTEQLDKAGLLLGATMPDGSIHP